MMAPVYRVDGREANAMEGSAALDPGKAIWNAVMLLGALAAPFFFDWRAVLVSLIFTYVTLLFGHSIGLHRLVIHRSYDAKPWLENGLIYTGALVGINGPAQIIRLHDTRDWAQRLPACHDFFAHRRSYWRDITWQLFYRFDFKHPPNVTIEPHWNENRVFRHLSQYWRWHQLTLAGVFFILGGWAWVLWCVCFRVALSTIGHWTITYICHNPGPAKWHVKEAGVQAADLTFPIASLLTHGECWHSNHHAFPESARIGLERGQYDPAARLIELFQKLGWVSRIGTPRPHAAQDDLIPYRQRP